MSDYNFQISIDGGFSERFIGILDKSDFADAILSEVEDDYFSDFLQELGYLHWSDLKIYGDGHHNGMHSGKIIVKQDDNVIFDISVIDDILSTSIESINDLPDNWNFKNGIYYLRIEWEGQSSLEMEGEVNEVLGYGHNTMPREEWMEDFENAFEPYEDLGVVKSLYTYTDLGEIDFTEADRGNPKGSDELIIAVGNVDGENKTIIGLTEIRSVMEANNVDLLSKDSIEDFLANFIRINVKE